MQFIYQSLVKLNMILLASAIVFYVSVAMSSNKIGGAGNCLTRKKQDRVQLLGIKTTSDMDLKIIFARLLL